MWVLMTVILDTYAYSILAIVDVFFLIIYSEEELLLCKLGYIVCNLNVIQ